MNAIAKNISLLLVVLIAKGICIHVQGVMCGLNIFSPSTYTNIFRMESYTCKSLGWVISESSSVIYTLAATTAVLITKKITELIH